MLGVLFSYCMKFSYDIRGETGMVIVNSSVMFSSDGMGGKLKGRFALGNSGLYTFS